MPKHPSRSLTLQRVPVTIRVGVQFENLLRDHARRHRCALSTSRDLATGLLLYHSGLLTDWDIVPFDRPLRRMLSAHIQEQAEQAKLAEQAHRRARKAKPEQAAP